MASGRNAFVDGDGLIAARRIAYCASHRDTQEPFAIVNNWMRGRSTIEFLGLWEKLSNPGFSIGFKPLEFERFRSEAGSNYFVLSPQSTLLANPNVKRLK